MGYRYKLIAPVVALCHTDSNSEECLRFCPGAYRPVGDACKFLLVHQRQGNLFWLVGSWAVVDELGNVLILSQEDFSRLYQPVEE